MRAVEIERRRAKLGQIRRASDLDEDQQKLWAQGGHPTVLRAGAKRSSSSRGSQPHRERPLPSRRTLIRQVPQLAGASLGTHGRTDVRAGSSRRRVLLRDKLSHRRASASGNGGKAHV
jgi:hypothetical protein